MSDAYLKGPEIASRPATLGSRTWHAACRGKKGYGSAHAAWERAQATEHEVGVYRCRGCGMWHLGGEKTIRGG